MDSLSEIYVLDLHGSGKKQEVPPAGGRDENVFDILQGVAICILVKRKGRETPARVHRADLWGTRQHKFRRLGELDVLGTRWREVKPHPPDLRFVRTRTTHRREYEARHSVRDIFPVNQNGIETDRDALFFDFNRKVLHERMRAFLSDEGLSRRFREEYGVRDSSSYDMLARRSKACFRAANLHRCLYRPFDERWLYYEANGLTSRPAFDAMRHLLAGENLALLSCRQQAVPGFRHVFCSRALTERCAVSLKTREVTSVFPLYLYPDGDLPGTLFPHEDGRRPNLSDAFLAEVASRTGLSFVTDGTGDLRRTFGPEDVFHYIYAVLHSPTYRERYGELLRADFPRIPLTSDGALFRKLCGLGRELVALHLLESPDLERLAKPGFPEKGSCEVEEVRYDERARRVSVNRTQHFEGVPPEVWSFQVGGYRVCEKWLKDRRGRTLSHDEIERYRSIVAAAAETVRLMSEIDRAVPAWPPP
jgi:predicted helicase